MRCEEALHCWQQALLGRPVDRDTLKEAYAHIGACWDVCAHTFCGAPDVDLPARAEQRAGQMDLYEALGLAAWQSAANDYHDGMRNGKIAFLTEGPKRLRRKRLESGTSSHQQKSAPKRGKRAGPPAGKGFVSG